SACFFSSLSLSLLLRPPRSSLFPYTTLFRSGKLAAAFDNADAVTRRAICGALAGFRSAEIIAVPVLIRGLQDQDESVRIRSAIRSEEHTSELQSRFDLVCRLLLEKKKNRNRS